MVAPLHPHPLQRCYPHSQFHNAWGPPLHANKPPIPLPWLPQIKQDHPHSIYTFTVDNRIVENLTHRDIAKNTRSSLRTSPSSCRNKNNNINALSLPSVSFANCNPPQNIKLGESLSQMENISVFTNTSWSAHPIFVLRVRGYSIIKRSDLRGRRWRWWWQQRGWNATASIGFKWFHQNEWEWRNWVHNWPKWIGSNTRRSWWVQTSSSATSF